MHARNLWRIRLFLFIVAFLIMVLVPTYHLFQHYEILWFYWGGYCIRECSGLTISSLPALGTLFMTLVRAIYPSIFLVVGIVGCNLTKKCIDKKSKITKAARLLTQINVSAILFYAILQILNSLISFIYNGLSTLMEPDYITINIYIDGFCLLPVSLLLAYISYDFSCFRALDFIQDTPALERTPEEIKSPPS